MASEQAVLAFDISGSRALLGRVTRTGGLASAREVRNAGDEAAGYWPRILAAAAEVLAEADVAAVGMSFGGPVDYHNKVVSIHVGGWADIDIAGGLAELTGRPVRVENDANCGALGEYYDGAWGRVHTLVFLTCSTGIGGGIVAGDVLFKGSRGRAGEVGHIVVDPDGFSCPCGSRGCLEAHCSGTAIARRATLALAGHPDSALARELVDGQVSGAKAVFDCAAAGDRLAGEVLRAVFEDYGRGIGAIQNVFDPDLIVIGGGVSLAGKALTEPLAAAAKPWLMCHKRDHLRVEAASLGLHAQLHGAAWLAWQAAGQG
ncbi:MAG: ROK family protein [Armatimonadetes bacterium]|nr:ROK family protein [Armatimonadota bacterium]